jgi:hypothetical protein
MTGYRLAFGNTNTAPRMLDARNASNPKQYAICTSLTLEQIGETNSSPSSRNTSRTHPLLLTFNAPLKRASRNDSGPTTRTHQILPHNWAGTKSSKSFSPRSGAQPKSSFSATKDSTQDTIQANYGRDTLLHSFGRKAIHYGKIDAQSQTGLLMTDSTSLVPALDRKNNDTCPWHMRVAQ